MILALCGAAHAAAGMPHVNVCRHGATLIVGHGSVQGVVGETYNRQLLGDAILNPEHPLFRAEDHKFHGNETDFLSDSFFGIPQ